MSDYRDEKFEQLVSLVEKLWEKFIPKERLNLNESEQEISAGDDEIVLSTVDIEVKRIGGKINIPGFRLEKLTIMPATLWEPEDSSVTHIGDYKTAVEAAAAFVNLVITTKVENYAHYLNAKETYSD